jgi:hypothetical protein
MNCFDMLEPPHENRHVVRRANGHPEEFQVDGTLPATA